MELLRHKELDYAIRYPKSLSKDTPSEKKYPLFFYLHGAGGRGRDTSVILNNSVFTYSEEHLAEAVTVIPQCYADSWFDIFEQLQDFIQAMIDLPYVDNQRVYVMGGSMGGYTTWQIAMSHPEWFAAILPICGGGMYWNASRLKNMSVWAFHGDADPTVFCEESIKMVNAINKKSGRNNAKLTIYEGVGHNSWDPTLSNPEVWKWMLEQRNEYAPVRTEFNDVKTYG